MILINGKKIEDKNQPQQQTAKKPSINEILQKMQNNYDNRVYATEQNSTQTNAQNQTENTNQNDNQNNLLLSILPALLKQKQGPTVQTQEVEQNDILKTLLKNLNNPMLENQKVNKPKPTHNKKAKQKLIRL